MTSAPARTLPPLRPAVFALFAVVYLYAFPYFDALRSANEVPRVLVAQELVRHGTLHIDVRLGELMSRQDLSRGPDGHQYQNKAPGPMILALPVAEVLELVGATSLRAATWAFRVFVVTLPALLFLPLFYRLSARFTDSEAARRTALVAYALGSPALVYSMLFFSHQLAAVCVGASFFFAVRLVRGETSRPFRSAAFVGAFAASSLMMDYQSVLALVPVGLYFLIGAPRKLRTWPLALAGAIPPATVLGVYHQLCFGAPWKTGYSFAADPSTSQGFMGIVGWSTEAWNAVLLAPSNGILVLAPWVVFALVGAVVIAAKRELRRRVGWEALVGVAVILAYLLFIGSLTPYMARGGWEVGPRYMTAALPFLGWLAATGFGAAERWLVTRILACTAVLASAVVFLAAATTYPHWPDRLANPLYELVFRLLWKGYAVHSLGTVVGLRGLASLLPLYLFAAVFAGWLLAGRQPRRWLGVAVALVLAGGIVAGHRLFPLSGPYSEQAWGYIIGTWEPKP